MYIAVQQYKPPFTKYFSLFAVKLDLNILERVLFIASQKPVLFSTFAHLTVTLLVSLIRSSIMTPSPAPSLTAQLNVAVC